MIKCNYTIKLDKDINPVEVVKSGESITVETVNAYGEHFKDLNELMYLINGKYSDKHHHPLTGPIDIEGAKAGDVLKVTIDNININIAAQALSKSAGIAPIEVNRFSNRAPVIATYYGMTKSMKCLNGMFIKYKPMLGMIGTAPAEGFIKTGHSGKTGGNLDIPFITEGCSIYLPIEVDGGKLFIGDAHAAQGYGELGGIALEASSEVEMQLEILKPVNEFKHIVIIGDEPFSGKKTLGIVGVASNFQDLNEAVRNSYESAVEVLAPMFPTINKGYICNIITALGNSMNGQAFSKTSESTCIINILEEDLRTLKKDYTFSIKEEFESVWFTGGTI